jgi:hypothetical protein
VAPQAVQAAARPEVVRVLPAAEWGAPVAALLAVLPGVLVVEVVLRLALALCPASAVSDRSLA